MQSSGDSARLPGGERSQTVSHCGSGERAFKCLVRDVFCCAEQRTKVESEPWFFLVQPFAFAPTLTTEKAVSILHEPWTSVSFAKVRCR